MGCKKFLRKKYDFERISRISRKSFNENFCKNDEHFRFRSIFRFLNEIFAKEIKRKFENPSFIQIKHMHCITSNFKTKQKQGLGV